MVEHVTDSDRARQQKSSKLTAIEHATDSVTIKSVTIKSVTDSVLSEYTREVHPS